MQESRLAEKVTVPPRSQIDVNTKAVLQDFSVDVDGHKDIWGTEAAEVQNGLLVARSLLPNRLNNLPVRLLSLSNKPIQLEKEAVVSPLVPLTAASVQVADNTNKEQQPAEDTIIQGMLSQVDPSVSVDTKQVLETILYYKYSSAFSKDEWDLD